MTELRQSIRQLAKAPAFTAVTVLSLAIGIGANTAVFTLVNGLLLRPLPVPHPEQLVLLRTIEGAGGPLSRAGENNGSSDPSTGRPSSTAFPLATFERLRGQTPALTELFALAPFSQVNVMVGGVPETDVAAQFVSGNYYAGLKVPSVAGRVLTPDDDHPGATPVAVISHRFWSRRFGTAQAAIGSVIQVNRVPTVIIGVTPEDFDGALQVGESADVSVPLAHYLEYHPDRPGRARPTYWWLRLMGRLSPGATRVQARLTPASAPVGGARRLAERSRVSRRGSGRTDAGGADTHARSRETRRERPASPAGQPAPHPHGPGRTRAGGSLRQRRQSPGCARGGARRGLDVRVGVPDARGNGTRPGRDRRRRVDSLDRVAALRADTDRPGDLSGRRRAAGRRHPRRRPGPARRASRIDPIVALRVE